MRPQSDQNRAASNIGLPESSSVAPDQAISVCRKWLDLHAEQEGLIERWQKLESEVCRLPGWRNLSNELKSKLPQSSAMKELDTRIDTLFRLNEELISGVINTGASTAQGLLLKLRVAEALVPLDENENAHRLLQAIVGDAEKLLGSIDAQTGPKPEHL